jgi:hypothetical protein
LWRSEKLQDIIKFYSLCPSVNDLINFSRKRKKPLIRVSKVRPQNTGGVVVVVPTANLHGYLSNNIVKVFDPLPMILVESSGDYFNYSYSLNSGIQEALKISPEWIVLSNDDLIKVDNAQILFNQLRKPLDADYLVVRPRHTSLRGLKTPAVYEVARPKFWDAFRKCIALLKNQEKVLQSIGLLKKYGVSERLYRNHNNNRINEKILGTAWRRTRGCFRSFYVQEDIGVCKSELFRSFHFDETFINDDEDIDFCFNLRSKKVGFIDFSIGGMGGASLSRTIHQKEIRGLRDIFGQVYFFYKNRNALNEYLSKA